MHSQKITIKPKRLIYFQQSADSAENHDVVPLKEFGKTAKAKFTGKIIVDGQTEDTRKRAKTALKKIKSVNKFTTHDVTEVIDVDFDMPSNKPASWNFETGRMKINGKIALLYPEELPFHVSHEAAHGGLMKETAGHQIKSEGLADYIAKRATGMDIGSDYSPELAAIEEMAQRIAKSDVFTWDGGKQIIKFNVTDDMDGLLHLLIRAFVKEKKTDNPVNAATALFQKAFPKFPILQNHVEGQPGAEDGQTQNPEA